MSVVLSLPCNTDYPVLPDYFMDISPWQSQYTLIGDVGISRTTKKYGNAAIRFGSAMTGRVDFGVSSKWVLAGEPFGISVWVYPTEINRWCLSAGAGSVGWSSSTGIHWLLAFGDSNVELQWWTGAAQTALNCAIQMGVWSHVEFNYNGSVMSLYVNGELQKAVSAVVGRPSVDPCLMLGGIYGSSWPTGYAYQGFIDDLLISKGEVLHTSNFTPIEIVYTPRSLVISEMPAPTGLSAYPAQSPDVSCLSALLGSRDITHGGAGRILGTVKRKADPTNLPLVRRVRLHETLSGLPLRETWSDVAGNYVFESLSRDYTYYATGFDHLGQYRGVIADNLRPEPM